MSKCEFITEPNKKKQFFEQNIQIRKTITSAVMVEGFGSRFMKPVQTGDDSDSEKISDIKSKSKTVITYKAATHLNSTY